MGAYAAGYREGTCANHFVRAVVDLITPPTPTGRTEIKWAGTLVRAFAKVLRLPRWCRQNSHVTCSKTRWQRTAYTVLGYLSVFPEKYSYRKNMFIGIESTCILSFFFLLLGNQIVLFSRNSNSYRLIYSRVLQSAQFCLF